MKKIFTFLGLTVIASISTAQIVINEVYGGGGNSGATFKNDFIELINNSSEPATITGATLQYATKTGTFKQYHPLPTITLNPGQTYLIQEAAGAGGTVDLSADFIAPVPTSFGGGTITGTGFNMSASDGKIALVSNTIKITSATDLNVLDFVGYGDTDQYEGTGATPSASAKKSVSRTGGVDTNNNSVDFKAVAANPQGSLAVSYISTTRMKLVKSSNVSNAITFGVKANIQILNLNGQVVKTAIVKENSTLDVSTLPKGIYFINADVDRQKVSQKILKN